jgi:hypothetical protein
MVGNGGWNRAVSSVRLVLAGSVAEFALHLVMLATWFRVLCSCNYIAYMRRCGREA